MQLTPNQAFFLNFYSKFNFSSKYPTSQKNHIFLTQIPIVSDRPHFVQTTCPISLKCRTTPIFVLDRMPKVLYHPHLVTDGPYFVPDHMLSRSKVLDRPHFMLDDMFFRKYFGLNFTFFMTWGYLLGKLNLK
ncbi:hypothetical protein AMTRI_Chr10g226200 [Amborella trichopoda]